MLTSGASASPEFPKLDQMLVSAGVYGAELSHFEGARLIVA